MSRDIEQCLREMRNARALRSELFDPNLFANPPWDIMLELYQGLVDQRQITSVNLSQSLPVPSTTTLRSVEVLGQVSLIKCSPRLFSSNVVDVELTLRGRTQMEEYFRKVTEANNPDGGT